MLRLHQFQVHSVSGRAATVPNPVSFHIYSVGEARQAERT